MADELGTRAPAPTYPPPNLTSIMFLSVRGAAVLCEKCQTSRSVDTGGPPRPRPSHMLLFPLPQLQDVTRVGVSWSRLPDRR